MANVAEIFEKARIAQAEYEKNASQEQVDAAVKAIGQVVYDRAEELAKMAVEESGMGVYEDKVAKCKGKSKCIWNSLKGKKSYGIIDENKETGIIKVAKPKGVVGAVTPVTNPVVTPMCNAMFALKGKNAIVVAPHPRTSNLNKYVVDLFRAELKKLGLPEDLVQTIENPSLDMTQEVMKTADVVVATGGAGMVKSAYSSGKPALGVGPGNVQVIIDRGIDYDEAARMIIDGRKFDNGIICSGEQSIIVPKDEYEKVIEAFEKNGAYYIDDPSEVEKFAQTIFPGGVISKDVVGQSVQKIAGIAGVSVPEGTKVVVLKARGVGRKDLLCKEKMCPFMIAIPYDTFEEAMDIAYENLDYEGKGHTCSIHSGDMELTNGFSPTTTLGCGSWGNNSISENLNYTHLINVSQIGLYNKDKKIPTDEEIWA